MDDFKVKEVDGMFTAIRSLKSIKESIANFNDEATRINAEINAVLTDVPDSQFRTPAGNVAHRQKVQVAKIKPLISELEKLKERRTAIFNEFMDSYKYALTSGEPKGEADRALFKRELTLLKMDAGALPPTALRQRLSDLAAKAAGDLELLDQLAPLVGEVAGKLSSNGNLADANLIKKAFSGAFDTNPEVAEWHEMAAELDGMPDSGLYTPATARKVAQELGIQVKAAQSMLEHADMAESFERHITKNGEAYAEWRTHLGHKEVTGTFEEKQAAALANKAHHAHYLTFEQGTMPSKDYRATQDKLAAKNTNDEVSE